MKERADETLVTGYGEGRTKKAAEQQAAYSAIKSLNKNAER